MKKGLIVVESPTKARTIKNYVGDSYEVKASVGHIKDLPRNQLGVDVDRDFEPRFMTISGKEKVIGEIKRAAKKAEEIYLAPDPDREGEAIAWHIAQELGAKGDKKIYRPLFNDLSRETILDSLRNPGNLDEKKFRSQMARRILDRLVGYQVSPILWEKVRQRLSAGRVQSVSLRLICERQKAIEAFESEAYWSIDAILEGEGEKRLETKLHKINGKKPEIRKGEDAQRIVDHLKELNFYVNKVEEKTKKKNPSPPFITSSMQQEGYKRLRFTAKKTMAVAQQLYEGIDLGNQGSVGLITYMRTDSVKISSNAMEGLRKYIKSEYGETYLAPKPVIYKNKKGAQEAHEAIRPVDLSNEPEKVKAYLNNDQYRLYRLIWNRFVSSQMSPARFNQTVIEIAAGPYLFRATHTTKVFDGFSILYNDPEEENESVNDQVLPSLKKGEALSLKEAVAKEHFTQPPPPFTEATLIRELEEKGIGRPSTYATILSNIRQKEYVEMRKGQFFPTELGLIVTDLLVESFPDIFDVNFTAAMEEKLDSIEEGAVDWKTILKDFYGPFHDDFEKALKSMKNLKKDGLPTDIRCEECGETMAIKVGRMGPFLSCSAFPKCKASKPYKRDEKGKVIVVENEDSGQVCDKCGKPMIYKEGRYGRFLACSGYPECRQTRPIPGVDGQAKPREPVKLGIPCPSKACSGELVERRTRKGKFFYGCSSYPRCNYAIWDRPTPRACPSCDAPFLVEKTSRREQSLRCVAEGCKYQEALG
jgi:DNA topoisomerase-1